MKLYTAFDLHSTNSYLAIINEKGERVFKKKLANDPEKILTVLKPFKRDVIGEYYKNKMGSGLEI